MLQGFHHKLSYTWKPWGGNPGVHPEWYSSPCKDPFTSQMLGELPVQISKFSLQKRVKPPEDSWVPCPVNPLETLKATMKATNFTRLEGRAEPGLHGFLALTGCAVSPGIVWLSQMWLSGKGVDIWVISRWRSSWPWKMWRCYEAWLCGLQICKAAIRLSSDIIYHGWVAHLVSYTVLFLGLSQD